MGSRGILLSSGYKAGPCRALCPPAWLTPLLCSARVRSARQPPPEAKHKGPTVLEATPKTVDQINLFSKYLVPVILLWQQEVDKCRPVPCFEVYPEKTRLSQQPALPPRLACSPPHRRLWL